MKQFTNPSSILFILIGLFAAALGVQAAVQEFDVFTRIEAESFNSTWGIVIEECNDTPGAVQVDYIQDGDWIVFYGMDFQDGAYSVDVRVATRYDFAILGHMTLRLDSLDATPMASFLTRNTSERTWATLTQFVAEVPVGVHDLYFTFESDNVNDFIVDFNWFQFYKD